MDEGRLCLKKVSESRSPSEPRVKLKVSDTRVLRGNEGVLSLKWEKCLRGVGDRVPFMNELLTGSGPLKRAEKARGEGGGGERELSRDPERSEKSRGRGRGVSPATERRASGKRRSSASAKTPEHQCSGAQAGSSRARAGCPGFVPHALSWRYLRRD